MITAVIFDLDGTLGNTLPLCIEAFKRSITPISGKELTAAEIIATFGPSEEGTIRQLIPDRYYEGIRKYWKWYEELHPRYPEPFPGVRELLALLSVRGVFLGLVTGKAEQSALISLDTFGLRHYFGALEYGTPIGPRKAEAIEHIVTRFSLSPEETVYVGDAPSDIAQARKAGVRIYAAAWDASVDRATLAALHPDKLFTTVEELADYLRVNIPPERGGE